MGINLHCNEENLWQTPTWVTYCVYSNGDGGWEGIKYRYIQWVKSHLDGVWQNSSDLAEMRVRVADHINNLSLHKKLNFSIG
ncbi:hypothetical protein [Zoogloea sp.]|uniref:hypothetical protein n=1 Tax=Zoogloea sp. TaxID=49181 RepID=UPI002612177C|nr:hypothetical protein [Zoogloea sp.]MDD3353880.1 hypothetical protein [Zoogloea sp.]